MTARATHARNIKVWTGLTVCVVVLALCRAKAQNLASEPDAKLDTIVSLSDRAIPVGKVLDEIAGQAGIEFDIPPYLRGRKVSIFLKSVTARAALDCIASLNDWRWYNVSVGKYRMERRPARPASNAHRLQYYLHAALPVDMRHFLRLPDLGTKDEFAVTGPFANPDLNLVVQSAREKLVSSLPNSLPDPDGLPFGKLTAEQQRNLLFVLFFTRYDDTVGLLHGDFGVQSIIPERSVISLEHGKIVMVDMIIDAASGKNVGFGTNVANKGVQPP